MQEINLHSSQLQETPSLNRMSSVSQFGDHDFTPSQDIGIRADQTPIKLDFGAQPHFTQDTVLMDVPESPVVRQGQRRGRLVHRVAPAEIDSDNEAVSTTPVQPKVGASNAFDKLRKGATKAQQSDFDKKASEARRMVEEQAEESEDEYAGLGGASDDEQMEEEANEADKAMIDGSDITVNERELAAFYAEKARNQDEVQTSKLYKDLMSGAMRRRRGAGGAFDLDSDEDEQAAERRRRKQREEARKRRLLLQDESVGKLGTNEKKEAFLRAIEDRDEDDDMDDLLDGHDINEDTAPLDNSQDQQVDGGGEEDSTQPLAETSANTLKRKATDVISVTQEASNPPPVVKRSRPSMRRNPLEAFRTPRSLQEVRDNVSFLIEDAHIDPEANGTMFSDDDEDDDFSHNATQPRAPASERRTQPKADIIDRLTLKKQQSSSSSLSVLESAPESNDGARLAAFTTSKASGNNSGSFSKLPSLLRRAPTSNSSMPPPPLPGASASFKRQDSASSTGSGNGSNGGGGTSLRMGGSKKSSINYQAREAERKIVLDRAERARKENLSRIAGLRQKKNGAGASGAGAGAKGRSGGSGGMFGGNVSAGSGFE